MSRISPRSGLDAIALGYGLRTWTRPPLAKGEGGTGSGEGGEERGEKEKKKLGIHGGAAPAGGAAYFARVMESGGERGHS